MKAKRTVCLNRLIIQARIGVHDFERAREADFQCDIALTMHADVKFEPVELSETMDYSELLSIIQEQTREPEFLLETVLNRIALQVFQRFPQTIHAKIHLQKLNPPLDANLHSSSVELILERE